MSYLASFGGRYILHPHYIIQILNDLYGIQGRSGCSCTGPYGHRLFKLADPGNPLSAAIRKLALENGENAAKPGWARVNFNYFIDDAEAKFIRDAVLQIASVGWRLLPLYQINPKSGQFVHRSFERFDTLRSLAELQFLGDACRYRVPCQDTTSPDYEQVIEDSRLIYENAAQLVVDSEGFDAEADYSAPASAELRESEWWCTPSVAAAQLRQQAPRRQSVHKNAEAAATKSRQSTLKSLPLSADSMKFESFKSLPLSDEGKEDRIKSLNEFRLSEMSKIMRPRG